jgi:hypothetical protein
MSIESLRDTAHSMSLEQLTAGVVVGLQWAARFIEDDALACFADESISQRDIAVLEIIREWLAEVSAEMISGRIQVGQFEVGVPDAETG